MATESPHKQEFRIRELSTRSVILFPSRAQIVRDIRDVALQPGLNQIIIDGLAPTVDEHSIKVEGSGAAKISEVTVDLLPNRDVFADVYPSDSEEDEDDDDSDEEIEEESMKAINENLKDLNVKLEVEKEKISSAATRLRICDFFGTSVSGNRPPPADLGNLLQAYQDEREKIFKDHSSSASAAEQIEARIKNCNKEKTKIAKDLLKKQEKVKKEKTKLKEQQLRKKAESYKEKQRVKAERESFWPKKVYRITITIEPHSSMTPLSSRRNSTISNTTMTEQELVANTNLASTTFHEPTKVMDGEIHLSLSYITYSASWSPRYDLSLDTVKCTGVLDYGAELRNTTSETWRDAKVTLSTSQTTFSGLSETIPTLLPWHVRLQKGQRNADAALFSADELNAQRKQYHDTEVQSHKRRDEIFGVDNSTQNQYIAQQAQVVADRKKEEYRKVNSFLAKTAPIQAPRFAVAEMSRLADQPTIDSCVANCDIYALPMQRRSILGSVEAKMYQSESFEDAAESFGGGGAPGGPAANSLVFEEGNWAESGMTTAYDLPGSKTLGPSNSTMKQKITKVAFSNVFFSHIIIGKLRQAAFLKARMHNTSKITLLKGPLGLSLDGAFLGQATFPRCSAGETFSLPLGVDPAIHITYPKPTLRRSQSGIFTKEDSNIFTRTIVLTNTKHNAPVQLTVLDQVPISEDQNLKIEINVPRGLKVDGEKVCAGTNAIEKQAALSSRSTVVATARSSKVVQSGKEVSKEAWGKADATAKKGGEVVWDVRLMPGCAVKLTLEYEMSFPGGEAVVNR